MPNTFPLRPADGAKRSGGLGKVFRGRVWERSEAERTYRTPNESYTGIHNDSPMNNVIRMGKSKCPILCKISGTYSGISGLFAIFTYVGLAIPPKIFFNRWRFLLMIASPGATAICISKD